MKSISKEIFIMALLLMIVVFMIGMVFYKYMPNNKTIPEPITYTADSTTTAVLQEISASNSYSNGSSYLEVAEVEDVIKSYSIGTAELSTAASKQTYVSGKTDPFAEYAEANTNSVSTDGSTGVANPNNENTTNATNTTNTASNSTGTFFEKKGSK